MRNLSLRIVFLASIALPLLPSAALAETRLAALESKASIVPILELTISEQAQSELKFGNVSTSILGPTVTNPKNVLLVINSNSGSKYVVTQSLSGGLENGQGQAIGLENLKFKTTSTNGTGSPVNALTTVTPAAQTVFASDEQGTSETISAEYQLTIPPSQAPGDYSALITYTVSSV